MRARPARPSLLIAGLVLAAAAVLPGCSSMTAQNPPGPLRPVNAAPDPVDERLMLRGADVVAYFTLGRHVPGSPDHRSVHEGVTFRFANAQHKALFDADPQRYRPQFGGYCTNGIVYAIPWGGDADTWRIFAGRLYIFGGQASLDAFELDVAGNLALAHRYWDTEIAGRNSFVQRARRLVFRVPHYQSGEELARRVAAAKAAAR